jgi:signal transduction histidine kinase
MPSRLVTPSLDGSASAAADQLWVGQLQRIAGRSAHEIKGALNGVSVNLEVVRSRAAKPDAAAAAVTKFAEAAAVQFEAVIEMTEALLRLTRACADPVDVSAVLRSIGALLVPSARADGRRVSIDDVSDGAGAARGPGNVVRLVIGAALLAAVDSSHDVGCRLELIASGVMLRVEARDGAPVQILDAAVVAIAHDSGIDIQAESSAVSISFPR